MRIGEEKKDQMRNVVLAAVRLVVGFVKDMRT